PFVEPPFEEEILTFLHFLGCSGAIRKLIDVNINKVEHIDTKKRNEMYYPRFTKVIIYHFMNSNAYKEYYAVAIGATPPKPKASVRKTRSSSDTNITPPTAAADPRLTTSKKGKQAAKASKAKSLSALSEVPIDESEEEMSWNCTDEEGDDDEGNDGDGDDEENDGDDEQNKDKAHDDDQEDEGDDEEEGGDDKQASDEEEFIHPSLSTQAKEEIRDEEGFDPIPKTPENSDDEGNGEENLRTKVGREEGHDEEEEEDELYRDININ
nr:hypothetical protein [Tanacetum cinerariifolium]